MIKLNSTLLVFTLLAFAVNTKTSDLRPKYNNEFKQTSSAFPALQERELIAIFSKFGAPHLADKSTKPTATQMAQIAITAKGAHKIADREQRALIKGEKHKPRRRFRY